MISLQALFVDEGDRARTLALLGSIRSDEVVTANDDGITQTVIAQAGVVLNRQVEVPNPVTLAPYRTFREVDQPTSPFVLRLATPHGQKLPQAALFEADGGAWRLVAMERIGRLLRTTVPDDVAVIV